MLTLLALAALAAPPEKLTFEQHVRPILKAYCLDCHGAAEKPRGKLDLRLRRFLAAGGRGGPGFIPGKGESSRVVKRMKSGEMPPTEKKVPAEQIALIAKWIDAGAPTLREEPKSLPPGVGISEEERAYWFYQPLRRPTVPDVPLGRVRTPVDAFVLAKLREKGLGFGPDADKLTLLRRATFIVTGLPPTRDEVRAFLSDNRPYAYERLVDRLLASPAYGERWARHWLDVAGYADSHGDGTADTHRPNAWRYRDWVVRALNANKPLSDFITEAWASQLAGDEMVRRPWSDLTAEQADLLAATGFLRTAPDGTASGGGVAEAEQHVADTVKIVSSSLLGLSVGCAQCHDHRYDPIPHEDYYRFRAVFEPALNPAAWRRPAQRRVSLYTSADRKKAAAVDAEVAKLLAAYNEKQARYVKEAFEKELGKRPAAQREALRAAFMAPVVKRTPEQKKLVATNPSLNISPGILYQYNHKAADELKADMARVNAKRGERPVEHFVAVLDEVPGQVPVTRVFHRGDHRQPKNAVQPGDLTVAAPPGKRFDIPSKLVGLQTTGRRLALARHLTSGTHPLFGRVMANRIWLHHMGRGIVDTPGDFGVLGQRPTHPELVDWLACELASSGWDLKAMHRLILTSTAFRQSSRRTKAQDAVDAGNALYGRFSLRRLEAEALRDRVLLTAGRLDRKLGGPAVPAKEDISGQVHAPEEMPRRGLYLEARRSKPVAFLGAFDAPVGELKCDRRMNSTAAPQALMLMNGDFVLAQAAHFARRVRAEAPFGRPPSTSPLPRGIALLPSEAWSYGTGEYDAARKRVANFVPLPAFVGGTYRGGAKLPDPTFGWALLHAAGGHAGNDHKHAAVRRWTAPRAGAVEIAGQLRHGSANGDGVRGRIVSSRGGLLWERVVKNGAAGGVARVVVQPGDTIDFAVDCNGDVNSDSFEWHVTLKMGGAAWGSAADFRGPSAPLAAQIALAWELAYQRPPSPEELRLAGRFVARQAGRLGKPDAELAALTNLCQQLLASSEFLYVD